MRREVDNRNRGSNFYGPYAGRDMNVTNIIMFQDSEREFVVTHNADIKPVSYFTGRETELQELRQRVEEGRKSVLVSGMGGIGKTHICRKLFEEYTNKHADGEDILFWHIGYVEYNGDMGSSLQTCLKFKKQDDSGKNQEAAWRELEYLAAGGKLLLFVDNVDKPVNADPGLQRLKGIPGAVILTSRQASFSDEFEPYLIGFLDMEQCKEIYEKIRFKGSGRKVRPEEEQDLKYIIEDLAGRHTITVELLAHLAWTKTWTVKKLRKELEEKGFCLKFHKDGKFVNIQESYETLYNLSELMEAEQNILEAFSVFPHIPLGAETCNQWLLADAGASENDDILMGLYQKGWLQFDVERESYSLHPVFAQFICDKSKPKLERHRGLIEGCNCKLEMMVVGMSLDNQHYISFAESIITRIGYDKEMDRIIMALAILLTEVEEYEKAEMWFKICLKIRKDAYGEDNNLTINTYRNLAVVYYEQFNYVKAEETYEKCIKLQEKVLGEEHPDTLKSYNSLAIVYSMQADKKFNAEQLHKKCIKMQEKILGQNHPDTINSYINLAVVYKGQREYQKALELCLNVYRILFFKFGFNFQNTIAVYVYMMNVYYLWRPEGNFEQWLGEKMKEADMD